MHFYRDKKFEELILLATSRNKLHNAIFSQQAYTQKAFSCPAVYSEHSTTTF